MDEGLRLSIVAGNYSPSLHRLIRYRVDEEQEMAKLEAVCRPAHFEAAEDEVESRAARIAARWAERPEPPPEMTPRAAAARSVLRDVAEGLLPF